MVKMLPLVGLVLLLLGGAAAYWTLLPQQRAAAAAAKPPPPGEFVALEPITMPVLRAGTVRRIVTIGITLELGPSGSPADLAPRMPRLRDALITELQALLSVDWPNGVVIDADHARRRMVERCRRLLGDEAVANLLFREIFERRV